MRTNAGFTCLSMVWVVSVGEIHARHVHASSNELRQVFDGLGLGANGANELGVDSAARGSKGALLLEVDGKVVFEGRACASPAPIPSAQASGPAQASRPPGSDKCLLLCLLHNLILRQNISSSLSTGEVKYSAPPAVFGVSLEAL